MCKRQSHVTVPLALLAIAFTRSSSTLDSEARKPQQTPPTISTVQGVLAIPGAICCKECTERIGHAATIEVIRTTKTQERRGCRGFVAD
jgi:hypothetical protein